MIRKIIIILFLLCSPVFGAVDFDGTDDLLNCQSLSVLDDLSAMTISMWVKLDTIDGTGRYLMGKHSGTFKAFYVNSTNAINLFVSCGGTPMEVKTDNNAMSTGVWTHLAVTWDGSCTAANTDIYVDGVEATYQTQTNGITLDDDSAASWFIGNRTTEDRPSDGLITEVAMWEVELPQADITLLSSTEIKRSPLQVDSANLRAYWLLNDKTDSTSADSDTFTDISGNGNTCTGDNGTNNTGLTWEREPLKVRIISN